MGASNPAVADDNLVVAYSSGEIFDLRTQNGRVAWTGTRWRCRSASGPCPPSRIFAACR